MGVKRPLEENDFPGLSFKQHKQIENDIRLIFMKDDLSSHRSSQAVDYSDEMNSKSCEFDVNGMVENGDMDGAFLAKNEVEEYVSVSFVDGCSSDEEDAGNEDSSFLYNFPGYFDLSIPWRPPERYQDAYTLMLNSSPRKQVLVGPEHQAELPQWEPISSGNVFLPSERADNSDWGQKMVGNCVIPMPSLNDSGIDGSVGHGRTDCSCLDCGSMRCVQQHVQEAREKLQESLGNEAFAKLGFIDMGEEVSSKWTANDEEAFHEVVFSNPASHGRDFWSHLSATFPTRSKKEIISYYFNVFMLRRRAVQNRSYLSQIDSDDDEDHEYSRGNRDSPLDQDTDDDNGDRHRHIQSDYFIFRGGDDGDVGFEPFGDQDLDADWVDDYHSEPEDLCAPDGKDANSCGISGVDGSGETKQGALESDNESEQETTK